MFDIPHIQLPFFAILLLLIVLARFLGEIMERLGQPAMIGEILAGVIVGPSVLNIVNVSNELKVISDLGVFLLIFMAGLEIDVEEIRRTMKGKNTWIAILGFLIPVIMGLGIGIGFRLETMLIIFLGLCIAITALPVSIRILMDLGKLNSDIGQKIISAAIFNDVVSLLVLGIILDFKNHTQSYSELFISTGLILLQFLCFAAIMLVTYMLIKRTSGRILSINSRLDKFIKSLKMKESLFAVAMVFVLIFASISELLGLHFVVGAFFGAILLDKTIFGKEQFERLRQNTSAITMGFLAPVFFAYIGIEFNIMSITSISLLLVVVAASFISKILGGYLGGKIAGMNDLESVTLGMGLNARGIMELIIANIALKNGFIDVSFFSVLVIMGIITTIFSPILLKKYFNKIDKIQAFQPVQ